MKIGVTSKNTIKIEAAKKVYSFMDPLPEIIGYSADSGVGLPVGEEVLQGARNRIIDVRSRIDDLDKIISIENGIFREDGQWVDRAVVIIYDCNLDEETLAYSDAVVFPDKYVKKAMEIGLDKTTVAKEMVKAGYTTHPKDPHITISGIPRRVYLERTLHKLVREVEK